MGRLFKQYLSSQSIIVCHHCNTHLLDKSVCKYLSGLELLFSFTMPLNTHSNHNIKPTIYNDKPYQFIDIKCNQCMNEIGWTMETIDYKNEMIFIVCDNIKIIEDN
jgi:ribosomal protein S27E